MITETIKDALTAYNIGRDRGRTGKSEPDFLIFANKSIEKCYENGKRYGEAERREAVKDAGNAEQQEGEE